MLRIETQIEDDKKIKRPIQTNFKQQYLLGFAFQLCKTKDIHNLNNMFEKLYKNI